MKWFKHMSDAKTSESLKYLQHKEGFAGIGRWWRLLEIISEKMDETDRCWVEFPIGEWCQLLGLKKNKLNSFLKLTENKLKTKVTRYELVIKIEVPKLLELRDNYTKHLQETTKQLSTIDVDKEVDIKTLIPCDEKPVTGEIVSLKPKEPDYAQELVIFFAEQWKLNNNADMSISWGKHKKIFKELLKTDTLNDLKSLIKFFFRSYGKGFTVMPHKTIEGFYGKINAIKESCLNDMKRRD